MNNTEHPWTPEHERLLDRAASGETINLHNQVPVIELLQAARAELARRQKLISSLNNVLGSGTFVGRYKTQPHAPGCPTAVALERRQ